MPFQWMKASQLRTLTRVKTKSVSQSSSDKSASLRNRLFITCSISHNPRPKLQAELCTFSRPSHVTMLNLSAKWMSLTRKKQPWCFHPREPFGWAAVSLHSASIAVREAWPRMSSWSDMLWNLHHMAKKRKAMRILELTEIRRFMVILDVLNYSLK